MPSGTLALSHTAVIVMLWFPNDPFSPSTYNALVYQPNGRAPLTFAAPQDIFHCFTTSIVSGGIRSTHNASTTIADAKVVRMGEVTGVNGTPVCCSFRFFLH